MADVPHIAVLLGTDHHPFDRLVQWVVELSRAGDAEWFVQHGYTRLPRGVPGARTLDSEALGKLLASSDAVITHGGPVLIMAAREAGHLPIVVPRDPKRREHADDHQQRFAEVIGDAGLAVIVHDLLELRLALLPMVMDTSATHGPMPGGRKRSQAFSNLVADVLAKSMTWGGGPSPS